MIVNIASECGFTPQLEGLEQLYARYAERGLEILAFPSDDFRQEPLDAGGAAEFCRVNYGVSFRIMEKAHVKGKEQHEVFHYLSSYSDNGKCPFRPLWNFQKYLVDREGRLRDYFFTPTKPLSRKVVRAVERLL